MEKEFVPYEQALALKELGFNEECLTSYHYNGTLIDMWSAVGFVTNSSLINPEQFNANNNSKLLKDYIDNPFTAAPTFSQAFRWFREKYNLHGIVSYYGKNQWDIELLDYKGNQLVEIENNTFWTYEEAELACLNKLIEIIKQK
jgi:hypothetical protein